MKMKSMACAALAAALVAGCASERQEQAKLQAEAKVSKADAEKTALARVPNGTVKEAGLEKEKGKLIWSFDVATSGSKDITEVNVDAISGSVVSIDKETPEQQAKEKDEDTKGKEDKDKD
jgi:uncharacterized membrane protein YkoI